ncbi:hypothetical protein CTRI78_v004877 [Colletotrichum trifolii]|uniref:Uncharacterized protein n=1 Tax=Colletotrichum trifolii TaxID=5466 RepID=A0A4R8RKM1_COLTR|nr:hypothetical protein CTRI78_v004877 [Colletotrichum trifolii]
MVSGADAAGTSVPVELRVRLSGHYAISSQRGDSGLNAVHSVVAANACRRREDGSVGPKHGPKIVKGASNHDWAAEDSAWMGSAAAGIMAQQMALISFYCFHHASIELREKREEKTRAVAPWLTPNLRTP